MKKIKITYQLGLENYRGTELLDEMIITYEVSDDLEKFDVIKNLNDSSLDVYDKFNLLQKLLHFNKELYAEHKAHADSSEMYQRDVDKSVIGDKKDFSVIYIFVRAVEVDDTTLIDLGDNEDDWDAVYDEWVENDRILGGWVKNNFLDKDQWSKIYDTWWI